MGNARWSTTDWSAYATASVGRSTEDVFASRSMPSSLNPHGVTIRESRDSDNNPNSNAIIVALDVTGSMGIIADNLARSGLGTMVKEILDRKPVSDPHIMIMGVGDAYSDRAPLQVTQFEADIRIAEQLKNLYLERGGGGNNFESYNLPWYFAAMHTSIDCFEKRGKKGYLFTVGDENPPHELLAKHAKTIFGSDVERDLSTRELLTMVERTYNVFHIVIEKGNYAMSHLDEVMANWTNLLGQRVIRLSDYTKFAETVVSAIEVSEGRSADAVVKSWSGDTSLVVARAVGNLATISNGLVKTSGEGGVTRF